MVGEQQVDSDLQGLSEYEPGSNDSVKTPPCRTSLQVVRRFCLKAPKVGAQSVCEEMPQRDRKRNWRGCSGRRSMNKDTTHRRAHRPLKHAASPERRPQGSDLSLPVRLHLRPRLPDQTLWRRTLRQRASRRDPRLLPAQDRVRVRARVPVRTTLSSSSRIEIHTLSNKSLGSAKARKNCVSDRRSHGQRPTGSWCTLRWPS